MAKLDLSSFNITPPLAKQKLDLSSFGLGASSTPAQPKTLEGTLRDNPSYDSQVGAEQVAGIKKIGGAISQGAKDITASTDITKNPLERVGLATRGIVGAGAGTITGAAQTALAPITPALSKLVSFVTDDSTVLFRKQNPALWKAYDTIVPKISELANKHPESATVIGDVINSLLLMVGGGAAEAPIKKELTGVLTKEGLTSAKEGLVSDVKTVVGKAKEIPGSIKQAVTDVTKGKTEQAILSTPEKDVYKLSQAERKVWFDDKQAKITAQSDTVVKQIKDNLKTQSDAIAKSTEDLQKQLATASRDKVLELRPKIIKAMGEQSKVYRSLIDEEMAGKESIPVKLSDLNSYIDTQYADNPVAAQTIKDKLGVPQMKSTEPGLFPGIKSPEATKTIGDIYNQTKALKQDISKGALKGNKTFTPEDVMTDKAINTLTGFLKKQGVDFSEANKFWAKYAPVRDQLASEAKPFLQSGTQTKTLASTLIRVAKGVDVNNENFISEVEKLIGSPINKENKAIVEKITTNQKTEIANKVAADEKLLDNEMATDKSLAKLNSQQFEAERQARLRTYVRTAIVTVLGLEVANKLGITKFLGL